MIRKYFWPLFFVFVAAIFASRTLIFQSGYFNMHDDLQMMRQLEMEKCFKDLQIPCRWVPDMGFGYGFPLFNFYPPLPYLVGEVFRVLQFSFVDTAKLTFALTFVLSGLTMYLLSKEFFGKWGGVISSVFYVWAPYHSVDVYVRGAMNESWALIWFPLILWTAYKLLSAKENVIKWQILLALSWVGLLLSHNLMVMIFTPVFGVWCLVFWLKNKNWNKFFQILVSGLFALALAAFFTLPSILEQRYIHVDTLTQGYYEYIAHFATIGQLLFSRFWGYGPSIWGPNDGMPFQIGQIHWVLSIVIITFILYGLVVKREYKKLENWKLIVAFFFLVGWLSAFMAHQNSTFIWQSLKPLAFVQFPWRFLTLAIFSFSFISGSIVLFLKNLNLPNSVKIAIPIFLTMLIVVVNWNYFLPQHGKMGPLTDSEKFSGAAWDLQRTAGIFDYLPETAIQNPKDPPNGLAEYFLGKGKISEEKYGTNWASFNIEGTDKMSEIRINIYKFPNWKAYLDGHEIETTVPKDEAWGRMHIQIPSGNHKVYLKLVNTPLRNFANLTSVLAWMVLFSFPFWGKKMVQLRRG